MYRLFRSSRNVQETAYWMQSDRRFNQLYPAELSLHARRHWTPLSIARESSRFLAAGKAVRVLDIGSGAGKFCLAGAFHSPEAQFHGVEQRDYLVRAADEVKQRLGLENVFFHHGNFSEVDFDQYHHFYFYNSFYENLVDVDRIDDRLEYSEELFGYYTRLLFARLKTRPSGTRLVTFHCLNEAVPKSYRLVRDEVDLLLKFWIKS